MAQLANRISFKVIFHYTKEFITKTTLTVIPACLESFFKKDAGQASMTEHLKACGFAYGLIYSCHSGERGILESRGFYAGHR